MSTTTRYCPSVLSPPGTTPCPSPDDSDCPLLHTPPPKCDPCGMIFPTEKLYTSHQNSPKHERVLRRVLGTCSLCGTLISGSTVNWMQHVAGYKHQTRARRAGVDGGSASVVPLANVVGVNNADADADGLGGRQGEPVHCPTCHILVRRRYLASHNASYTHRSKAEYARYTSVLQTMEQDKNNVVVEGDFDFGVVEVGEGEEGVLKTGSVLFRVGAEEGMRGCELDDVVLASRVGVGARRRNGGYSPFTVSVSGGRHLTPYTPGPLTIKVTFRSSLISRYSDRLELHFHRDRDRKGKTFIISRELKAVVVRSREEYEALKPVAPYVPRSTSSTANGTSNGSGGRRQPINEGDVVQGIPPTATTVIPYVVRLPQAFIPNALKDLLSRAGGSGVPGEGMKARQAKFKASYMPKQISTKTHTMMFKHLLWAEEVQAEQDLERYDMTGVTFTRHNQYYYLTVPGLAEKRPSLLVGDKIYAQPLSGNTTTNTTKWYEGHVHFLRQTEVGLRFHSSFDPHTSNPHTKFHVRFSLTRIPLRRQHQALDIEVVEERIVVPSLRHMTSGSSLGMGAGVSGPPGRAGGETAKFPRLRLFNKLIGENKEQLDAVGKIVAMTPGEAPFIVFGPPGTGKTITIVESIQQLLVANPSAKILACAPSNSAADLIALRLAKNLTDRGLFRFYAPSRSKDQVPDILLSSSSSSHSSSSSGFTCLSPSGQFTVPPLARLKEYRVVVTTCISASFAANVGVPKGHFSHIFVDEAGQATEPEVMVALKTMVEPASSVGGRSKGTNVVLSGDPKQLGPIVRSSVARRLGLEISYLERLIAREGYYGGGGGRVATGPNVVQLTKNFRSHHSILRFPDSLFYNSTLEACAPSSSTDFYLGSFYLPAGGSKKFPVVFRPVVGQDMREASSPSFFNPEEVMVVKEYVARLKADRKYRTADQDIGVITPYHAQCQKIRRQLSTVASEVKVGSVEEFQGQERKVIIISTVRSSEEFVEYDIRHTLGFVASPRRFNVAVTRAKSLLIIIGNPHVLGLDPLWRSFLNYIHTNGGWLSSPSPSSSSSGIDIPWDPQDPVHPGGGYDALVREGALFDMGEFVKRVERMTMGGRKAAGKGDGVQGEEDGEDEDGDEVVDANVDKPWVNDE